MEYSMDDSTRQDLAVRIISADMLIDNKFEQLRKVGVELDRLFGRELGLFDLAADVLGVPEEVYELDSTGECTQWGYCRDWLYDAWGKCDGNAERWVAEVVRELTNMEVEK
jgi:hypothetical protein